MHAAAELARESRRELYFARSIGLLILLEADARAALGQHEAADSLYRLVADPPPGIMEGDWEGWIVLQPLAARALR